MYNLKSSNKIIIKWVLFFFFTLDSQSLLVGFYKLENSGNLKTVKRYLECHVSVEIVDHFSRGKNLVDEI